VRDIDKFQFVAMKKALVGDMPDVNERPQIGEGKLVKVHAARQQLVTAVWIDTLGNVNPNGEQP
jgi:hypothetical protein